MNNTQNQLLKKDIKNYKKDFKWLHHKINNNLNNKFKIIQHKVNKAINPVKEKIKNLLLQMNNQ